MGDPGDRGSTSTLSASRESVFALSNGHIGLRGNLDEGEPAELHGTYLNGVLRDAPAAVRRDRLRLPRGRPVDDQRHRRQAHPAARRRRAARRPLRGDRRATSGRSTCATASCAASSSGVRRPARRSAISSTRLVSFTQRGRSPRFEVVIEPVAEPARIVAQSELVANEPVRRAATATRARPRRSPRRWRPSCTGTTSCARRCCTARAGSRISARRAMDHDRRRPAGHADGRSRASPTSAAAHGHDRAGARRAAADHEGARVRLVERGARPRRCAIRPRRRWRPRLPHGLGRAARRRSASTSTRSGRAPTSRSRATRSSSRRCASRSSTMLQAGARAEMRAIPAKGLTGRGYDGHTFWDTEIFVLPVADLHGAGRRRRRAALAPSRRSTSRRTAPAQLGLRARRSRGGRSAARSAPGYWPAGTAAFHVNADIADAVRRYVAATEDERRSSAGRASSCSSRPRGCGARVGHHDAERRASASTASPVRTSTPRSPTTTSTRTSWRSGTSGSPPTPSSATPTARTSSASPTTRSRRWRRAADAMHVPFDVELGVHPQAEGFTAARALGLRRHAGGRATRCCCIVPYYLLYRSQVVKQADLVLALYLAGESFSPEQKARDFAYYEAITVRDSSLSACDPGDRGRGDRPPRPRATTTSAESGARRPPRPGAATPADGVHLAVAGRRLARRSSPGSAACATTATGSRSRPGCPAGLDPDRVPVALPRPAAARRDHARRRRTYELLDGEELPIHHHGDWLKLEPGPPVTRPLPPPLTPEPVQQPPGRESARRAHGERVSVAPDE